MRPLLGFCAIVKNEASNFRATLESIKGVVDCWLVLDTGSTDGTQEVVRSVMPSETGTVIEEPFVDFATSRNRALELIAERQNPIFTLTMSGDETLFDGKALRTFLEERRDVSDGAFYITMQSGVRTWPFTRILRADAGWKYSGVIHEKPVSPNGIVTATLIPGARVVHRPSDPERKIKRLREYDQPQLQRIVDDESKTLEERAHAIFFLAETETALAAECPAGKDRQPVMGGPWLSHQMKAMSLYWRYAQIADQPEREGYDPDKVHYSLFMYFHLAEMTSLYSSAELAERLEQLVAAAPRLPEARFLLAKHAALVDTKRGLFLATEAARVAKEVRLNPTSLTATDARIEWLSLRLAAACSKSMGKSTQARDFASAALAAGGPKEMLQDFMQ